MVTPHAGGRPDELMPDGVLPGPTVAELLRAAGATREDLGDVVAIRRQYLAQALVVSECP